MKGLKAKIFSILISIVVAGGFLYFVLVTPSPFNLIPFAIHDFLFQKIIEEHVFIVGFDILVAGLIFVTIFRILEKNT